MNYKIAIVDQDEETQNLIVNHFEELKKKDKNLDFRIDTFSSGEAFLTQKKYSYDLLFLEVDLPGIDGLETAKLFRKFSPSALIIFNTHNTKYAIDGYTVNAFAFLVKPISISVLQNTLIQALKRIKKANIHTAQISITTTQGLHLINVSDILYVEVQRHTLFYYIIKNNKLIKLRTYGSMKDVAFTLGDLSFKKCSACYLINLKYVNGIEKKNVLLPPNITLPISRQFLKSFSNALTTYFEENHVRNVD